MAKGSSKLAPWKEREKSLHYSSFFSFQKIDGGQRLVKLLFTCFSHNRYLRLMLQHGPLARFLFLLLSLNGPSELSSDTEWLHLIYIDHNFAPETHFHKQNQEALNLPFALFLHRLICLSWRQLTHPDMVPACIEEK